jgi:predicted transcriptional regulator
MKLTRQPKTAATLTPLELKIMQVLWVAGPCTVAEVQVLLRKSKVKRVPEGRAYRYQPAISRERAAGSAVHDLVKRMFGGSNEALLMAMVDARQISAAELERIAQRLATAARDAATEE